MFKITVSGNYVISGKLAQIDEYETSFIMSEGREAEARAIIQNSGMLDERLRKEKKNYKRWRTCNVTNIEEAKDGSSKDVDQELDVLLVDATELGCIPTTYKRLASNVTRKKALQEAIKKKKSRIKKAKAKRDGLKEMAA